MRDMKALTEYAAELMEADHSLDITAEEIQMLKGGGFWYSIVKAYTFGFAVGYMNAGSTSATGHDETWKGDTD